MNRHGIVGFMYVIDVYYFWKMGLRMSAKVDFIIGGSGSGKSTYLKERIADEAVKNPDKKYIMIVPEQAASMTERDMVKIMSLRHGKNGFMNIDIIGISRLAYKILDEAREHMGSLMSDAGKSMLIRLVAGRTDLKVYKKSIDKEGFIAETKSLLSELFQYDITLDDIEKVMAELDKTGENLVLSEKLHDMAAIYKGFEERIDNEKGMALPSERMVAYLLSKLEGKGCNTLDNAVIAFDGFTGYTPSQYSLIEELMKRAERLSFAITMDAGIIKSGREVRDYELFYLSYQTYIKLCTLTEKVSGSRFVKKIFEISGSDKNVTLDDAVNIILLNNNMRHGRDGMLYALEKKLFRVPVKPYEGYYYTKSADGNPTSSGHDGGKSAAGVGHDGGKSTVGVGHDGGADENVAGKNYIRLWECHDPEGQLSCIAQEIKRKVKEDGLRYRDIAVLAPNLTEMSGSFDKVFEMYDIPFFPDYTRELSKSPFTEAILSLLNCEEKNYDYDSMFSLLKTGVIEGLDQSEISILENHALSRNVKSFARWNRSFSYVRDNVDKYEAEEAARKKAMQCISEVHGMISGRNKTVRDHVDAIRFFMTENQFEIRIEEAVKRFEEDKDYVLAGAYRSLYRKINEFLDKMVDMLGEEKVSIREFAEIFKTGINEIKVGTIPAVLDSVTVGDIERTRVADVKVIFLINANDGIIPKPGKAAKILSDRDKGSIEELFARLGISKELAPDEKKSLYIEQFYLYLCMAKPSQELIISKCRTSMSGEELEGSYILSRLLSIFPNLKFEKRKPERFRGTAKTDVYFFSEMVRNAIFENGEAMPSDEEKAVLYALFRDKKPVIDKAAGYRKDDSSLTSEAVEAAKNRLMVQSVSKLENYAECEYRFFLNYMLRLRDREGSSIDSLAFGNIIHGALERLFRDMDRKLPPETYKNWVKTSDEELSHKMRGAIEAQLRYESDDYLSPDGAFIAEGKDRFVMDTLFELGERTIKTLAFHIRGGDMSPKYYEDKFDVRDKLTSSSVEIEGQMGRLKLTGKIDRADIFENGDDIYLRIIDYKTGNNDFSYGSLRDGRQFQLPLYLSVMIEKVKNYYKMAGRDVNVIPVGMYYYPVKDPYITRSDEDFSEEELEKKIRMELRLKGITSEEAQLQEMQENSLADPDREKNASAEIIPLDYYSRATKDKAAGDLKGTHVALSRDEFDYVTGYARLKAKELTDEMFRGEILKNPAKTSSYSACDYCAFKDACRFDPVNRDNKVKKIIQDKDEDAYQMIKTRGAAYLGIKLDDQGGTL